MNSDTSISHYQSPIGLIEIKSCLERIISILFIEDNIDFKLSTCDVNIECVKQLEAYFKGTLAVFNLPILQEGTGFQNRVWNELHHIPYGETISYLELAHKLGNAKSVRAVGTSNGKNKIMIVLPCHRVIGSKGNLTGYAGGLVRKDWLLKHEIQYEKTKIGKLF